MESEDYKRQIYNTKALDASYETLKESIGGKNEFEIFKGISETLFWIIAVNDWFYQYYGGWKGTYAEQNKNTKEGQVLSGLRHAYNSVKHNMLFDIIHERKDGLKFPTTFPFALGTRVLWIKAGETLPADQNRKNEVHNKENYEKQLEGNAVLSTFRVAIDFLFEEKEKVSGLNKGY